MATASSDSVLGGNPEFVAFAFLDYLQPMLCPEHDPPLPSLPQAV
jgi:hypothetical protein